MKGLKKIQPGMLDPVNMHFFKLFGFFEYTFPTKFLSASKWQTTPESKVRKAAGEQERLGALTSPGGTQFKKATRVSPHPDSWRSAYVTYGGLGLGKRLLSRLTSTWECLLLSVYMPLKYYR